MLHKLRLKFIIINMAIVTLMLLLIMGVVLRLTESGIERESESMMRQIAMQPFFLPMPDEKAEFIRLPYFVLAVDGDGQILEARGSYYDLTESGRLEDVLGAAKRDGGESGMLAAYGLRYLHEELENGDLYVFSDMSNEASIMNRLMRNCLLIFFAGFAAFLIVSIFLSRWAVRPVERAWEDQRRFVADASHELKTPLAVILTNAEQVLDSRYTEQERSVFSQNIYAVAQQMRTLVERLLDLARLESRAKESLRAEVDLTRLASEEAMLFEPVFFERGLELSARVAEGIAVRGDEAQLRQAVEILLDNAAKYSDSGTVTELELKKLGNAACTLSVINVGAQLTEEQRRKIFQRFYRADGAHRRDGSCGLGLPIAEGIVRNHGGKIRVESRGGQNTFSIQLPMLKSRGNAVV